MSPVPALRIQKSNEAAITERGDYILYGMIARLRLHYNFALDRALEHCTALGKPLVIFEALRIDYPWASDRLHRFVLDGMAENAQRCQEYSVRYYPYIEPARGAGKGLLAALAEKSCVVVTDNFPCFFLPHMVASVAKNFPSSSNQSIPMVCFRFMLPIKSSLAHPIFAAFCKKNWLSTSCALRIPTRWQK